jgi:hypothetical protein
MRITEADESFEFVSHAEALRIPDPRQMTRAQLRRLGIPRLVYLRSGTTGGHKAFSVHAADGTAIAVVEDIELATELVVENNMTFVALH